MLVTTSLTSLVMVVCWRKPPLLALAFFLFFGSIEALYFSASLIKFLEGAWLPILLALILMAVMYVWHYATIKKHEYDLHNKVSLDWLLALGDKLGMVRVPGIGLVYTGLIAGVPANFSRFVTNLPAFHRILVFVCIKSVPVPHVPPAERYLVGRVGPPSHRSYRCIARYGYRDVHQDMDSFESELIARLADFIKLDSSYDACGGDSTEGGERRLTVIGSSSGSHITHPNFEIDDSMAPSSASMEFPGDETDDSAEELEGAGDNRRRMRFCKSGCHESESEVEEKMREELEELSAAQAAGTAFILGHSHVRAKPGSSFFRKVAIEFGYNFLRKNCRGPEVVLRVPPASLLEVGMVYVL